MSKRVRWGILGTGWIAGLFTRDLRAKGLNVTAVGSRTRRTAEAFAAKHGINRMHASYEDLVADDRVDAIYVATPHPFHADNATLALEAGKHVLVEKPFAMNANEARRIMGLAARKGLIALEAMWTRWLPHMVRLREILAQGTLGEIRTMISDHTLKLSRDAAHRINAPELGGGALLDLGIYPISFASQIFGPPNIIFATSTATSTGVDRSTTVILGHERGGTAITHSGIDARGTNRAIIIGTEARIEIDPIWYAATSFTLFAHDNRVMERFEYPLATRGMEYQALELERLVIEGKISGEILPSSETVSIMETLDEARRQIGLKYPCETLIKS
jgi:predicted dehydrogenase